MDVQELIDALQKLPDKTIEVNTEGCDCIGDINKVEIWEDVVMLCRSTYQ